MTKKNLKFNLFLRLENLVSNKYSAKITRLDFILRYNGGAYVHPVVFLSTKVSSVH